MVKKRSLLDEVGAEEVDSVPAGRARTSWDMDGIKQLLMEAYDRAKKGGKPGVGMPVDRFIEVFHPGGPVKHAAFYCRKKILEAAEELGYKVKVTTVGGKRIYVAFLE